MKRSVGLWIDHREAFLVFVGNDAQESDRVVSGMEKHVRFSGGNRPQDGSADDQQDRQFTAHLNRYYDDVISHVREAASILILGPGEAKGELQKRLASKGLGGRIVGVETVDKMTAPQIAARVRERFRAQLAFAFGPRPKQGRNSILRTARRVERKVASALESAGDSIMTAGHRARLSFDAARTAFAEAPTANAAAKKPGAKKRVAKKRGAKKPAAKKPAARRRTAP